MKKYKVLDVKRLNNSVNGNPRYELCMIDEEENFVRAKTQTDCSFAYGVNFNAGELVMAEIGYTRAGNAVVRNAKNIKEVE